MTIGILGKKLGMTQLFEADGTVVPCTVIQAGPCRVLQVKVKDLTELPDEHKTATINLGKRRGKTERTRRADGYYALQLGFDARPAKSTRQPDAAHCAKAGVENGQGFYFVKEVRGVALPDKKQGEDVSVADLEGIEKVDVTGTTKGRGWTGTIKRWNFHRQRMTHGAKKCHRHVGGTGRTYGASGKGMPKGKKSSGHYGVERVTIQSLPVVKIDVERNLLLVKGAVPGPNNGYLIIRRSVKLKG
ncbi:MAG: 50S ribosomal protein L3 [Planctomycetes bacterium]|jgi:large subunit ribosomal protein L3|nr:50S ribosomal protein L3 [Planctomycetota bacterium]